MEETKKSRGGAREGAGRHKIDKDEKKVTIAFSVTPELKARIHEKSKSEGVSVSQFICKMLESI